MKLSAGLNLLLNVARSECASRLLASRGASTSVAIVVGLRARQVVDSDRSKSRCPCLCLYLRRLAHCSVAWHATRNVVRVVAATTAALRAIPGLGVPAALHFAALLHSASRRPASSRPASSLAFAASRRTCMLDKSREPCQCAARPSIASGPSSRERHTHRHMPLCNRLSSSSAGTSVPFHCSFFFFLLLRLLLCLRRRARRAHLNCGCRRLYLRAHARTAVFGMPAALR